jgi:hypothetical protein
LLPLSWYLGMFINKGINHFWLNPQLNVFR